MTGSAPVRYDKTARAANILLIGSYNGQDSLGDACLLRSVISQFERTHNAPEFVVHLNQDTSFMASLRDVHNLQSNQGIQSLSWLFQYYWRKSRLPDAIANMIARVLFPVFFLLAACVPTTRCHRAFRQICRADTVVVFGGTNFSRQWFWGNIPYYFLTCVIAGAFGARCYFSAQQYGPMTTLQSRFVRLWVKWLVSDFRLRNEACLSIFARQGEQIDLARNGSASNPDIDVQFDASKGHLRSISTRVPGRLIWDEVYSNTALYPIHNRRLANDASANTPLRVLMNIRGSNLVDPSAFSESQIRWYEAFVASFVTEYSQLSDVERDGRQAGLVQWRLFAVSGPGMSEDYTVLRSLADRLATEHDIELMPRIKHESHLIDAARSADLCVSMSFHGCVLASFAGIPVIPFTDGYYYDYKYADFSRYGDGSPIPQLRPGSMSASDAARQAVHYLRHYDAGAAAQRRQLAASEMNTFYEGIAREAVHSSTNQ